MKNNKRIGIIGDCHFGTRNGNPFFRKFAKDWLLTYLIPLYKEAGITDLFELGDWFDQRRYTLALDLHWQINEMIPLLAGNGMTLHMLPGNHSMPLKNNTEINSTNALVNAAKAQGSLCVKSYDRPTELTFAQTDILVLPWICDSNFKEVTEAMEKSTATVVLSHAELSGFIISAGKLAESGTIATSMFEKFELSLQGHYHLPSEKTLRSGTLMKYVGVPYHQNTADADFPAENGVHILDCVTQELTFVPNPEGMSIFQTITYDYGWIESEGLEKEYLDKNYLADTLGLRGSVIRVEVVDKSNSSHYKRFISALRLVDCVNFTTQDLTDEVETIKQDVTEQEWKDSTLDVLVNKAESTDGIHNDKVVKLLKEAHQSCLDKSNLV